MDQPESAQSDDSEAQHARHCGSNHHRGQIPFAPVPAVTHAQAHRNGAISDWIQNLVSERDNHLSPREHFFESVTRLHAAGPADEAASLSKGECT